MEHANSSLCDIGGSGGLGGGLGGGGGLGMTDQAEGGPSLLEVPSMRRKLVSHEEAPSNMKLTSVTDAVFHEEMSWLNEEAPENMVRIDVTLAVFHEEMSWLNEEALANM